MDRVEVRADSLALFIRITAIYSNTNRSFLECQTVNQTVGRRNHVVNTTEQDTAFAVLRNRIGDNGLIPCYGTQTFPVTSTIRFGSFRYEEVFENFIAFVANHVSNDRCFEFVLTSTRCTVIFDCQIRECCLQFFFSTVTTFIIRQRDFISFFRNLTRTTCFPANGSNSRIATHICCFSNERYCGSRIGFYKCIDISLRQFLAYGHSVHTYAAILGCCFLGSATNGILNAFYYSRLINTIIL